MGRSSKPPSQRVLGFRRRRGTLAAADRADCCCSDIAELAIQSDLQSVLLVLYLYIHSSQCTAEVGSCTAPREAEFPGTYQAAEASAEALRNELYQVATVTAACSLST
jgi:hypothetical protein